MYYLKMWIFHIKNFFEVIWSNTLADGMEPTIFKTHLNNEKPHYCVNRLIYNMNSLHNFGDRRNSKPRKNQIQTCLLYIDYEPIIPLRGYITDYSLLSLQPEARPRRLEVLLWSRGVWDRDPPHRRLLGRFIYQDKSLLWEKYLGNSDYI